MNYYNEFDPRAAAWLRELITQGLIPAGIVDTRSITEINPHELKSFIQCHFFAGIGGWSLALQLAGWPTTRPVWTGSCPCQPFSTAGKQLGQADERHLWPVFFNLIRECRPQYVFGEQVAAAIGKGWLDGVSADLEGADYACGSAVIGAHSVGSPHIRQRLYWLADATGGQREQPIRPQGDVFQRPSDDRATGRMGNPNSAGPQPGNAAAKVDGHGRSVVADGGDCRLSRLEGHTGNGDHGNQPGRIGTDTPRPVATAGRDCWSRFDLIPCADGKARRIEPGLAPLAHGVLARVVRLRGYGNAIVPQVAAEFVGAYLDTQNWRN
jgi:DNA (cytosine-5)-methyltransferase 1